MQFLPGSKKFLPIIVVSLVALLGTGLLSLRANNTMTEISEIINDSSAVVTNVYQEAIASQMVLMVDTIFDPLYNQEPATLNKILLSLRKYDVVVSTYILDAEEKILADGMTYMWRI